MNLAVEYMIRSGAIKELPVDSILPCSVVLIKPQKKVISIYPFNNEIIVKHWLLYQTNNKALPPRKKYKISKNEIYSSEYIIPPNCKMLTFKPQSYKRQKQLPMGRVAKKQEIEYNSLIDNFCNPEANRIKRENWLWREFTKSKKLFLSQGNCFLQKKALSSKSRKFWNMWLFWKKNMLFESKVASELLFYEQCRRGMSDTKSDILSYKV